MFIELDDDLSPPVHATAAADLRLERWFVRCVMLCACLAPAWAALGGAL